MQSAPPPTFTVPSNTMFVVGWKMTGWLMSRWVQLTYQPRLPRAGGGITSAVALEPVAHLAGLVWSMYVSGSWVNPVGTPDVPIAVRRLSMYGAVVPASLQDASPKPKYAGYEALQL